MRRVAHSYVDQSASHDGGLYDSLSPRPVRHDGARANGENWFPLPLPRCWKFLFWHSIFATIPVHARSSRTNHIFPHGMGRFNTLLVELSKDPAMIVWLDNR